MTMREKIDEYLDGALGAAERRDMDSTLSQDPQAAALLARMKRERALRSAAYESYAPDKMEAGEMASQVMAACEDQAHEPVGHIGHLYWTRRIAGVAAALIIAAGAFAAGRVTAPQTVANSGSGAPQGTISPQVKTVYSVHLRDGKDVVEAVFDNEAQKNAALRNWDQGHGSAGYARSAGIGEW